MSYNAESPTENTLLIFNFIAHITDLNPYTPATICIYEPNTQNNGRHDRSVQLFINTSLLDTQNAFRNFENNYGHVFLSSRRKH